MIREARFMDVPRLVEMGQRFIASTEYKTRLKSNPEQLDHLMRKLIAEDDGLLLVDERDGAVVGMVGIFLYRSPISGQGIASEVFWWMEPGYRGLGFRLLRKAESIAKSLGVELAQMTAPNERVARIYKALGYSKLEEQYQKAL